MNMNRSRAASLGIWGLLGAFALLQGVAWMMGTTPRYPWGIAQVIFAWFVMIILAVVATRRIRMLAKELKRSTRAHRATQRELDQLQVHNAVLEVLARTVNVPLAFHAIAPRIAGMVPCDRVGLALLSEDGEEFQTYTARLTDEDRRASSRPEVTFKMEGTAIGSVVRSRAPLIVDDTSTRLSDFLDMNVTHSSGFLSALVIPLVSNERAVGTLNLVSRRKAAFTQADADALLPLAEILAMAHVAQQLQIAATKHRTLERMTHLTEAVSAEIGHALQTIVARCEVIDRANPDPRIHREIDTITRQAKRISAVLDRMRHAGIAKPVETSNYEVRT
jgi:transcriptional regulator with GAF, ATPase, and Fis domain